MLRAHFVSLCLMSQPLQHAFLAAKPLSIVFESFVFFHPLYTSQTPLSLFFSRLLPLKKQVCLFHFVFYALPEFER